MAKPLKKRTKVSGSGDGSSARRPLTVETLEARIAPAMPTDKKAPAPPPYPSGSLYGLISRVNLRR